MTLHDRLTLEEFAFVQPSDETLEHAYQRTDAFLDRTLGGLTHPLRSLYKLMYRTEPREDMKPAMRGIAADEAQRLEDFGFTFLTGVKASVNGGMFIEYWRGPDGAVRLETADGSPTFLWLCLENGRKLSMAVNDGTTRQMAWLQPGHDYLFREGDLVHDYKRLIRHALAVCRAQDTRPLFMRDAEQFRRVDRFYDEHMLSIRFAIVATSPVLMLLGAIAWMIAAAIIG